MTEYISINHGSGGRLTSTLIRDVIVSRFGMEDPLTDSAVLVEKGFILSFTTDSYVVDPIFFPGGDIGKLAVCGTINDLSVSGAIPRYISASFILEEGFPIEDLKTIIDSMSAEAKKAGVKIVTGDTKVVEKGKCDKIFINTSGIGILSKDRSHISSGRSIKPGDKLIINGHVGSHSIAVLGARKELGFISAVESDCASLNYLINSVLSNCNEVHFMRDLTRGGLVAVLNEMTHLTRLGIVINESSIPVQEEVRGLCEILGFDPLYMANEGKALFVVDEKEHKKVLGLLRSDPLGRYAEIIGEVVEDRKALLVLNTSIGGTRLLDLPSGTQLPRIC